MNRNYPRLSIQDFGSQLLESCDLDPVYVALRKVLPTWGVDQLDRWLVAYWCFYSCGFASWICEHKKGEYWTAMAVAAHNLTPSPLGDRWPRGRERRHFRGKQAISSIESLKAQYQWPEGMVIRIVQGTPDYQVVSKTVTSHVGFGPWIGFKVCDMVDRILEHHIDFTESAVFMFKDPIKAAVMYYNLGCDLPLDFKRDRTEIKQIIVPGVVANLTNYFAPKHKAPPIYERPVNLQEIETILCKWKSHMNGHYPLNTDIVEIREGVEPWCEHSLAARQFLEAMPNVK